MDDHSAAYTQLRKTTGPIEAFNLFIQVVVNPRLHAHYAEDDDNAAEFVRRAIRDATR